MMNLIAGAMFINGFRWGSFKKVRKNTDVIAAKRPKLYKTWKIRTCPPTWEATKTQ